MTLLRPSTLRGLNAHQWLQVFFAGWLFLAVLAPGDTYRVLFHALIYPATLYMIFRKDQCLDWKDPFLRLFLLFCGYMAITTWFVGHGAADKDAQAFRWGAEAALGMLAFFLWMPSVVSRPELWGRIFLWVALGGTLLALVASSPQEMLAGRISGVGAMEHPIQGASIAVVMLGLGVFLLANAPGKRATPDLVLLVAAIIAVSIFVSLSKSRAPIIAMAAYLLLMAGLFICRRRPVIAGGISLLVIAVVLALIHWLVGLPAFYEQLIVRGDSYRLDIWRAYLSAPPESLFLGHGAGVDYQATEAARVYLQPEGLTIAHPHNIWLGAFTQTGIIGLLLQAGLVLLPVWGIVRAVAATSTKIHLLALVGLFLMLTFTDEHTLLVSVHPVWVFGWTPLVFVWIWSRKNGRDKREAERASRTGGS